MNKNNNAGDAINLVLKKQIYEDILFSFFFCIRSVSNIKFRFSMALLIHFFFLTKYHSILFHYNHLFYLSLQYKVDFFRLLLSFLSHFLSIFWKYFWYSHWIQTLASQGDWRNKKTNSMHFTQTFDNVMQICFKWGISHNLSNAMQFVWSILFFVFILSHTWSIEYCE